MVKKGYKIGVDLGTVNTLVYINGHGLIFNEPSCVAFDRRTNNCIAIGHNAYAMMGKEHHLVKISKPLEGGVIADLDGAKELMKHVFTKLVDINVDFKNSTLLICCPSEVSSIERAAIRDLSNNLGIKDVFVEEEVKAGAIGAGLDIFAPIGSMIIDIGGGSTDIGVLALGDLVVSESIRVAGRYLDNQIIKYCKMRHGMAIGSRSAEKVKLEIGTLRRDLPNEKEYTVSGRNIKTGLPGRLVLKQSEIRDIFVKAFEGITITTFKVLQQTPPELAADIFENGIMINGGGALIDGIKEYFEEAIGLKMKISLNPLTAIVDGTKYLLKNRGNYLIKPLD